ncbi:MAG: hypothetical protein RBS16_07860 [Candidatus Cloacimonadales bacterium]|jgi:hypothetical protein|nr:hypothetical protein [Candidatus Cloacimonadota bacterium]MDD2650406.1 hypothetical protein [Candidatus Cloacimonadota bacterium]MDX9977930.1 hypothetical protein [Candidatus Cloacimonadales bacterium]
MPLQPTHLLLLKEYIDELIVNSGIIKVNNPERVVEKVKVDFLVKLAFRFYSKLYNSEKFFPFIDEIVKRLSKGEENYHDIMHDLLDKINNSDEVESVQCLNCNTPISKKELIKSGENMPLCDACKDHIGLEIDIWEKIFGD